MCHLSHEGCIEGRRQRDALRKGSGSGAHESVQGLIERDDGNTQSRLLQKVFLHPVDLLCHSLCLFRGIVLQHLPGRAARLTGGTDLKTEDPMTILFLFTGLHLTGDHEQLPEPLLRRHATQEILHPGGDGLGRILINSRLGKDGQVVAKKTERENESFHVQAFRTPNVRSGSQGSTKRRWREENR